MFLVPRFITSRIVRLHGYINQNYRKVISLCLAIGTATGTVHWLASYRPDFVENLNGNLTEFPFGVAFGILTIVLIATILLYALHLESVEKSRTRSRTAIRLKFVDYILLCLSTQLKDATERYLRQGMLVQEELDAMHTEIEDCIDRFRESARKLLDTRATSSAATLQELENFFRLDQQGIHIEEEILKLKRNSKSLLSERTIKELLTK
ncbi:uncharacterized protein LOC131684529 [Topomyia yanbarensis]|uniref:uncharacterized protein LOC131684529 n=1 Tax=Topomyia yanbarensis TaxID=2498891 RepID=UPI00273A81A6|nr:uncharacterized protein LOC131684529 [Topomyia yanbarensis]